MIMKKTFFNINKTAVVLLLVAFASCKKLIEIPANPPSSITQKEQFADSATTVSAVAGVYSYTSGNGFAYADGALTYCTALSSDELSTSLTGDYQQFYGYSLTQLTGTIDQLWSNSYKSIYMVNAVLSGVATNSTHFSPSFQKQVTGEMEVVRALYYFNLVNLYGDVPLVTTTDYSSNQHLARTPTATVYHQIMADLADARKKLIAAYPSSGHIRPNLYTAIALQAKVNLYLSNWQSAYNEADSVINAGLYSVTNTPLSGVFLDGSNEAIWQIPAIQSYQMTADAKTFVPGYKGATPNYVFSSSLKSAFETGDQRVQNWTDTMTVTGKLVYYPYKYKNISSTPPPLEDQMILRLAEVYLIRAEAAAHLNNLSQAMADVNVIRSRAGLQAVAATTQTAVLSAVMKERQTELFCEWGSRWFDLKRTGTAAAVLGSEKTGYTADAALYPLPQSQLLLNNQLKQNPGYH